MSFVVYGLVWKSSLKGTDKLIALRLADYADDHGRNVYPSVRTVAEFCGVYERTVQRTLQRFRALKLLVETRAADPKAKTPAHYRIDLVVLDSLARTDGIRTPVANRHRWQGDTPGIMTPVSLKTPTGGKVTPKPLVDPLLSCREESLVSQDYVTHASGSLENGSSDEEFPFDDETGEVLH